MDLAKLKHQLNIDVRHIVKDDIWIATSDDIRGLVVESQGFDSFLSGIIEVSSELLAHNHGVSHEDLAKTSLCCHISHDIEKISTDFLKNSQSRILALQLAAA